MRALVHCKTKLEQTQLQKLLQDHHWWPGMPQENNAVQGHVNEIIEQVYETDRPVVEQTFKFALYDDETRTWGIVSEPNAGFYTFRLKNPSSDKLKHAAEKLISDLTTSSPTIHQDGRSAVQFIDRIEVFEPLSNRTAFLGQIINRQLLRLAIKERRNEVLIGTATALLAILISLLTSPIGGWFGLWGDQPTLSPDTAPIFLDASYNSWQTWFSGNLERFATALLAASLLSWAELFFHWLDLRRESPVRWTFELSGRRR